MVLGFRAENGLIFLFQYGQLVYGWRLLCRTSRRECHRDSFVLVQFCCQLLICTIFLSLLFDIHKVCNRSTCRPALTQRESDWPCHLLYSDAGICLMTRRALAAVCLLENPFGSGLVSNSNDGNNFVQVSCCSDCSLYPVQDECWMGVPCRFAIDHLHHRGKKCCKTASNHTNGTHACHVVQLRRLHPFAGG